MTLCTGRRQRLAVFIGREELSILSRGGRDRRQTGIVRRHMTHVRCAHAFRHLPGRGVSTLSLFVFVYCREQITLPLRRQVWNTRCGAPAIQAMTALAFSLREGFAHTNIRRSLFLSCNFGGWFLFIRAANQR